MKTQLALNITKIVLILLGAAGLGGYSYTNHQRTSRGYEALAQAVNVSLLTRLDTIEARQLEATVKAATSQPVHIDRIILPGRVDPWPAKAPAKAASAKVPASKPKPSLVPKTLRAF